MMRRAHTRIPIPSMFPRDVPERASERALLLAPLSRPHIVAFFPAVLWEVYDINWNFSRQLMHICEVEELY